MTPWRTPNKNGDRPVSRGSERDRSPASRTLLRSLFLRDRPVEGATGAISRCERAQAEIDLRRQRRLFRFREFEDQGDFMGARLGPVKINLDDLSIRFEVQALETIG